MLGPKRAAGIALAGTTVALLVAGMATWMFLPTLPFALLMPVGLVMAAGSGVMDFARTGAVPHPVFSGSQDWLPLLAAPLVFVPLIDFLVLLFQLKRLRILWKTHTGAATDKRVALGTLIAFCASVFFLIIRPALIGHWTMEALHTKGEAQKQTLARLRLVGGQQTMLDLTYHRNPSYWVCIGYQAAKEGVWPWVGYGWNGLGNGLNEGDAHSARRAYFLMTGTPFESVPRPLSARRQNQLNGPDDVAVEETGGYVVGRPVPGLELAASHFVFSTDAQTETGEGTWEMTFANHTDTAQEARADILLPPGATCHAVSLWINGTERPAAFGSPQKVRNAYQEVAVVKRRDPLLVTMPAPGHLLAQCFPVPARGTMKIKLGITTPLTWRTGTPGSKPQLELATPVLGPVNFDVPDRLTHLFELWNRQTGAEGSLPVSGATLFTSRSFGATTLRDAPRKGDVLAPGVVRTADPLTVSRRPVDVWLLLDASQGMNEVQDSYMPAALQKALGELPAGSHLFLTDTAANDAPRELPVADVANALSERPRYVGGVDPAPALAQTLHRARTEAAKKGGNSSVVLFLHAASPNNLSDWEPVRRELHQSNAAAGKNGPVLVSVQLAPRAPDAVAMDLSGFDNVYACRVLPGDIPAEAVRFAAQAAVFASDKFAATFIPIGGHGPAANGVTFGPVFQTSSAHPLPADAALSRLHRASLTTALWFRSNQTGQPNKALDMRIAAGQPAAIAHLVTPVSSAVVLETRADYERNGLNAKNGKKGYEDAKKAPDPRHPLNVNVPEPPPGVLLTGGLLTGLCAAPLMRRRRVGTRP